MALEMGRLAVQDADARRTIHLVAGEDEEVAVQLLHVDRQVRSRLGAIHQHRNARPMRHLR